MPELVPALFHFLIFLKNPVHGPDGTKVLPLIEESGVDLAGSKIDEPFAVKSVEHDLPFMRAQGPRWRGPPR